MSNKILIRWSYISFVLLAFILLTSIPAWAQEQSGSSSASSTDLLIAHAPADGPKSPALLAIDQQLGSIQIKQNNQIRSISYSDVALEGDGKICVCGSFTFRALQAAIPLLFPNEIPEASQIMVEGAISDGVEDALKIILANANYQLQQREQSSRFYDFKISNSSNGKILNIQVKEDVYPADFFKLKKKYKAQSASAEELKSFQSKRAQLVERVQSYSQEQLFAIEVSESSSSSKQPGSLEIPAKLAFTDITGHWAESSIKKMAGNDLIKGYSDGSFKPDNSITRAEFTVLLVKAFNLDSPSSKVFSDSAHHWAGSFIGIAAEAGIVNGYSLNKFQPDSFLTREQMAVIICKAAKTAPQQSSAFADQEQVASWAQEAVSTAKARSLISGYPDNSFKPQARVSRAEAITAILAAQK